MASSFRPVRAILLGLVCLTGLLLIVFWPKSAPGEPPTASATPRPAMTVTAQPPDAVSLPVSLTANGTVAAWDEAVIGTELTGIRLMRIEANIGDHVSKGQLLAEFAGEQLQAELQAAMADAQQARASLTEARQLADRARQLRNSGAMSRHQIDQSLAGEQAAKARVDAAEAVIAQLRVRVRNLQVLAPDDGMISARSATLGSVPNAASTELFRMIRQGRLEWRAEVPAQDMARLQSGTPVSLSVAGSAPFQGRVRALAPSINTATRNGIVYVDIDAALPHAALRAGVFATGAFLLGNDNAIVVDQQAIVPRDGYNHLFVLEAPAASSQRDDGGNATLHQVRRHRIDIGRRDGHRVEIRALRNGNDGQPQPPDTLREARIVVRGAGFLNDGDLVRVVQEPAASAPDAASPPEQAPARQEAAS